MFDNVAELIEPLNADDYPHEGELSFVVSGVSSTEGEQFPFVKPVVCRGGAEEWLSQIETAMFGAIKDGRFLRVRDSRVVVSLFSQTFVPGLEGCVQFHSHSGLFQAQHVAALQTTPAQLVLTAAAIVWQARVHGALVAAARGNKSSMRDQAQTQANSLSHVVGLSVSTTNTRLQRTLVRAQVAVFITASHPCVVGAVRLFSH